MATTLSVPFTIMVQDGIRERWASTGPTATVKFKCLWTDRYRLAQELVGTSVAAGNQIIRVVPFAYPTSPNLFCMPDLDIEPHGKPIRESSGWLSYKYAIVTANFGTPPYSFDNSDPSGKPWTVTNMDVGGEFLTLPGSTYRFPDGTPTNTPIGKVIPQVTFSLKRHWMPYLPVGEMLTLVGKVNDASFDIGGFACPEGTLLFMAGPNDRQTDTTGSVTQEVQYKLVYRSVPWNFYLHPNRTSGFQAVTDGNGDPPYESGDFTILP
jgi:hypothetical protein